MVRNTGIEYILSSYAVPHDFFSTDYVLLVPSTNNTV